MSARHDSDAIAEVDSVVKQLGETLALDGVSLRFAAGTGTAIIGESGSGKSTLLELLIGLHAPDAGEVRVFGNALTSTSAPAERRRLGFAVQRDGLFPHLTVEDNILLPARLDGLDVAIAHARGVELARLLNLPLALLKRYPHELSGGQRQRAGICRAMILEPPLLLLDEPFSGLDAVTRSEFYSPFLDLVEHCAASFVLVTHDIGEARALCECTAVLRNGRLIADGPTREILSDAAPPYVRELLAAAGEAEPH